MHHLNVVMVVVNRAVNHVIAPIVRLVMIVPPIVVQENEAVAAQEITPKIVMIIDTNHRVRTITKVIVTDQSNFK